MQIIFGEQKEEVFLDTKYLKYSRFKNGYLEEWTRNKYDLKTYVHSSFTYNEISSLAKSLKKPKFLGSERYIEHAFLFHLKGIKN